MALLSFRGISTPSLQAQGEQRRPSFFNIERDIPREGGLISYGPDAHDIVRRSASYVDRVLRGERPGELPVQAPIKFELLINLKTAKALGLIVPPKLLVRADEVIESDGGSSLRGSACCLTS